MERGGEKRSRCLREFLSRRGIVLYPTLNQPLILLAIFLIGILGGLLLDVARLCSSLLGNLKFIRYIFEFSAVVISMLALFIANLNLNYGSFRIYVVAVFLLSFVLERILSKILWTKLLSKWYSSITKSKQRKKSGGQQKE